MLHHNTDELISCLLSSSKCFHRLQTASSISCFMHLNQKLRYQSRIPDCIGFMHLNYPVGTQGTSGKFTLHRWLVRGKNAATCSTVKPFVLHCSAPLTFVVCDFTRNSDALKSEMFRNYLMVFHSMRSMKIARAF